MIHKKYILSVFLVVQILFLQLISQFPNWVEKWYCNGFFPVLSKLERKLFGWIPFSIGDIVYFFGLIYLLLQLIKVIKKKPTSWTTYFLKTTNKISVIYFVFHLMWGLNYYRMPLFGKMDIKKEYSKAELIQFTNRLIEKTNQIQFKITKNKNQRVTNLSENSTLFTVSQNGYKKLAESYPDFNYIQPSQKESLFSKPLTYMGFSGYLNPFTNEMQVNYMVPKTSKPMVVCHEMAHQIGYASESECNFIGFLAAVHNDDLFFQYSAYANALRYCLALIAMEDEAQFKLLKTKINTGIVLDFKENEQFWNSYESIIDKGFHAFYDHYLKINQQKEGISSYSKYIDLMINYYQNKNL